jgi:hypothetical protein
MKPCRYCDSDKNVQPDAEIDPKRYSLRVPTGRIRMVCCSHRYAVVGPWAATREEAERAWDQHAGARP